VTNSLRNPFRSRFLVLCLTDWSRLNTNFALKFTVFVTMASAPGIGHRLIKFGLKIYAYKRYSQN